MVRQRLARTVVLALLLLLSACGIAEPSIHVTPAAAFIHLSGEPIAATDALEIQLVNSDQEVDVRVAFQQGVRVIAQLATLPGTYTLTDTRRSCTVELVIDGGTETDVLLEQSDEGGCSLMAQGQHPAGEGPHSFFGTLTATLAAPFPVKEALLKLRSVDVPPNPVPGPVTPDETGRFFIEPLAPGRYEVQVVHNATVVAVQDVEIGTDAGAAVSVDIEVGATPSG